MNQNEQDLLEGLRALAAQGPQAAPAHVEEHLLTELRRRSWSRRRNVWLASGAGAIAAGLVVLTWVHPAPPKSAPFVAVASVPAPPKVLVQPMAPSVPGPKPRRVRRASAPAGEVATFYSLPDTEELPPVENATVVRVQLPMSSLRLIGFPVNEERAAERIQADVLLGQDGLARGVRFVQ